ncbi:hypothetical protein OAI28_05935, partial [Methylophilaceae bacterium]|nr:hypothetical protein [Methylophilaceae bacterium]
IGFKKVGESCSEMTTQEKIIQLRMLQTIRNSRSSDDDEEEDVDGACYDGYRKCKSDCPSSVYDWETSEYLYNTDANSKCEDACKRGKRACEYEDNIDDACYAFNRKCKSDCPSSVYDWETSEYLYNTDANSKCEDACKRGKRACD